MDGSQSNASEGRSPPEFEAFESEAQDAQWLSSGPYHTEPY